MPRSRRRTTLLVPLLCAALLAGACSSDGGDEGGKSITYWTLFNTPDRMARQQATAKKFADRTGIQVKVVGLVVKDMNQAMVSGAASGNLPDVVMHTPDQAATWHGEGLLDVDAANQVIDRLGRDTFNDKALGFVTVDGQTVSVPSDGWGQMLFYRKDLFAKAGLAPPKTMDDVLAAARKLHQGSTAGIVLGTKPGEAYTSQNLEWIALANGCQLAKEGSATEPNLESAACVNALRYYQDLAAVSVKGAQDVMSTRATYLAGRAAMASWSPHLLDEIAGLDPNFPPTCPQCKQDKAFIAKNSGIVPVLTGPDTAQGQQFGQTLNLGILRNADSDAAKQFAEFLLGDGYAETLGVGAEGRFPLRPGPKAGSTEFVDTWAKLPIGPQPKNQKSIEDVYGAEVVAAIQRGATQFSRWGFGHGSEKLVGAVTAQGVLTRDLEGLFQGQDPGAVARKMSSSVAQVAQELPE